MYVRHVPTSEIEEGAVFHQDDVNVHGAPNAGSTVIDPEVCGDKKIKNGQTENREPEQRRGGIGEARADGTMLQYGDVVASLLASFLPPASCSLEVCRNKQGPAPAS